MHLRAIVPVLFVLAAGCAKESLLDPKLPGPDAARNAKTAAILTEEAIPNGAVSRAYLNHLLREGPGYVLDQLPVEEVVLAGKFIGWRLRELPPGWDGGALHPGDLVTRINGLPLETPNEFWAAWTTLNTASELKIDYRRGEETLVLTIPVVGQAEAAKPALSGEAPQPSVLQDKRFETVTIEADPNSATPPADWTTAD